MIDNLYNPKGFFLWVGVVEDRMDPLLVGRCRVRISGYHNPDPVELPVEDLPWAYPMQPITSAAISGVGQTPTGPVEGTWVVGFFRDGEECQDPVMLGTIGGIPIRTPPKIAGFRDPEKTLSTRPNPGKAYPRPELLKESDLSRLARHQKISETIVGQKDAARDTGVPVAFGGTWDQPKIPYNAKYPFNHVYESESGHVLEFDDTKNNERVHIYHRKGTFEEIDVNGTRVNRIVGDGFEIFERNSNVHIKGKCNVTIDGDSNIYVKNNCNLQVDGNLKAHAHGNIEMKAGKKMILTAKENIEINTDANFNVDAKNVINMRSLKGMNLTGTLKTTIASPITEVAVLKMNALSMTPLPPVPPVFVSPSTISSKSPTNPSFSTLTIPSRDPDVAIEVITPITEKDDVK